MNNRSKCSIGASIIVHNTAQSFDEMGKRLTFEMRNVHLLIIHDVHLLL